MKNSPTQSNFWERHKGILSGMLLTAMILVVGIPLIAAFIGPLFLIGGTVLGLTVVGALALGWFRDKQFEQVTSSFKDESLNVENKQNIEQNDTIKDTSVSTIPTPIPVILDTQSKPQTIKEKWRDNILNNNKFLRNLSKNDTHVPNKQNETVKDSPITSVSNIVENQSKSLSESPDLKKINLNDDNARIPEDTKAESAFTGNIKPMNNTVSTANENKTTKKSLEDKLRQDILEKHKMLKPGAISERDENRKIMDEKKKSSDDTPFAPKRRS